MAVTRMSNRTRPARLDRLDTLRGRIRAMERRPAHHGANGAKAAAPPRHALMSASNPGDLISGPEHAGELHEIGRAHV